jgi:outer membrane protein W
MKAIKYFLITMVLFTAATAANAQYQKLKLQLNYNTAIPLGNNFKDFIGNTSFRGGTGSILYSINPNISVGLTAGFQDFYQKYPRQLYKTTDGSDISAVISNSVQLMPLMLQGQYNFLPSKVVQPYVGLAVGGNLINYRQFAGEFADSKSKFGFAASPEAGVQIGLGALKTTSIVVGANYNYMPFKYNDIENFNSLGIHAGIKFPIR